MTERPARRDWTEEIEQQAGAIRDAGRWRRRRVFSPGEAASLSDEESGRLLVSFASNDYLGLSRDPRVIAAAKDALDRFGAGSGASRLVTGTRPVHVELEAALAAHHRAEQALVFPTGYMANLGALGALGGDGVTICSDALNHASIIDGARLASAAVAIYRHLDLDHLEELLATLAPPVLVVSELVFSMDGDVAPVAALGSLCARYGALLVLDEAHAVLEAPSGSYGGAEVLHIGTLSKTLGSLGGYVAGHAETVALIENRARSYLFTTGSSPADVAAAYAALAIVDSPEGDTLREQLCTHLALIAPGHPSPIVPFVLGSETAALQAARTLAERGFHVPAIRPPTVPAGSSRLRVTLSSAHRREDIVALTEALARLGLTSKGERPRRIEAMVRPTAVVVVGTATDVGKTHVATELISALRGAELAVAARKPLQSYAPEGGLTDAERLAKASGERTEAVCDPRFSYGVALAPPIAAALLGEEGPHAAEVLGWLEGSLDSRTDVAVIELVGGLASPHTVDADGLELLGALAPALVLLVAHSGLGTLNDISLALHALRRSVPGVKVLVLLNRYDEGDIAHTSNFDWLVDHDEAEYFAGNAAGRTRCYEAVLSAVRVSRRR